MLFAPGTLGLSFARGPLRSAFPLCAGLCHIFLTIKSRSSLLWKPTATRMSSSAPYKSISTDNAPGAIGPYVQATVHNGTIYCSGCIPFDPKTMALVEGGIEVQAQRALDNLLGVVEAAGGDKSTVLKTSVFLKDVRTWLPEPIHFCESPLLT